MNEQKFDEAMERQHERVLAYYGRVVNAQLALEGEDENGVPLDRLGERAWEGRGVLMTPGSADVAEWVSPILESPTYIELLAHVERRAQDTGDLDHVFLEAVTPMCEVRNGVPAWEMHLGS